MKDQKQKKTQLGVEGTNTSGQRPSGQNPNVESPETFSIVPHTGNAGNHSLNSDDNYFDSFPPGYRFKPYDGELVVHYLLRMITNMPLPPNQIKVVELYKFNPSALTEKHKSAGEMEWYFFTPRDRKYRNGDRPNRAAGDGYWKATGADRPVKYDGKLVGYKKALVFYKGKAPRGDKTNWIMHEYIVANRQQRQKGGNDMRLDNWVLCRIYKKTRRCEKASTRKQEISSQLEVPTQPEHNGKSSVDEDSKIFSEKDIFFQPQDHGNFDVSDYYSQGGFSYDSIIVSCPSPSLNFQNELNWLDAIPSSYNTPLGFQQQVPHHNPTSVADFSPASETSLPRDQTSPIKTENFGCITDDVLRSFDPQVPNLLNS